MLKDSYHYMYFRNPTDSVANLNRFIATINRIVPLSPGKERIIREQAMAAVRQQTEKLPLSDQMFNLIYSIDEHITLMGTNVIEVIRNNFDAHLRNYGTRNEMGNICMQSVRNETNSSTPKIDGKNESL